METMNSPEQIMALKHLIAAVGGLLDLATRLEGQGARVMEHSETLATRVESFAERLDEVEKVAARADGRERVGSAQMDMVTARITKLEQDLGAAVGWMQDLSELRKRVDKLAYDDKTLEACLAGHYIDIGKLGTAHKDLVTRVDRIEADAPRVGAVIESLAVQGNHLVERMGELEKSVSRIELRI